MNEIIVRGLLCLKSMLSAIWRQLSAKSLLIKKNNKTSLLSVASPCIQGRTTAGRDERPKIGSNYVSKVASRCLHKVDMTLRCAGLTSHTLKPNTSHIIAAAIAIKILFCVCLAHAGQRGLGNPAAAGVALSTDSTKPLQIGDSIPEALWNLPLQMVKAGQEGTTTVKLEDYKGKLIILDFWSTWCGGCIKEMPKVAALKDKYKRKVVILSITTQDQNTVRSFFNGKQHLIDLDLNLVSDATGMANYFPHRLLPHLVWLDRDGKYMGATSSDDLNDKQLNHLLSGVALTFRTIKNDLLDIDYSEPLINKGSNQLYGSAITGHLDGYPSRLGQYNGSVNYRLYAINLPILTLYKRAMNLSLTWPNSRILIGAETKELLSASQADINGSYCYELIVPKKQRDQVNLFMLQDLNRYFGLDASLEKRQVACLVLKATGKKKPKPSKAAFGFNNLDLDEDGQKRITGQVISKLTNYLNSLQNSKPLLNETGIDYKVDLNLGTDLHDLEALNKVLYKQGLYLAEESRSLDMLVFSPNHQL